MTVMVWLTWHSFTTAVRLGHMALVRYLTDMDPNHFLTFTWRRLKEEWGVILSKVNLKKRPNRTMSRFYPPVILCFTKVWSRILFLCHPNAWSLMFGQATQQPRCVSAVSLSLWVLMWVWEAAGPTWTLCTTQLTLTSQNWSESCSKPQNPEVHIHKCSHAYTLSILKLFFFSPTNVFDCCLHSVELHLQWLPLRYSSPHCCVQSLSGCCQMSAGAWSQPHCQGKTSYPH